MRKSTGKASAQSRNSSEDPALSTAEAARYLGGMHVKTLATLARTRQIEFVQSAPGGPLKFRRSALNAYLERHTTRPSCHSNW
ncbi:helix-turn-helix domain-containing protein [bacterium]|nr:helix-turn-helix domain-containing protein [bacterium]